MKFDATVPYQAMSVKNPKLPQNYDYRRAKYCLKMPVTNGKEATSVPTVFASEATRESESPL
jgi:hypothetical protein